MKNYIFYFLTFIAALGFTSCADDDQDVPTNLEYPFKTTETYSNASFVNSPVTIQIKVENDFTHATPGDLTFSMTYSTTKDGIINLNGQDYSAGDEVPLHLGENSVTYTAFVEGNHTITLNYKNNKGQTVTKTANINVTAPQFDFNINGTSITPYIGNTYNISLYINNMNSPESTTYQFSYTLLEGTAELSREENLIDVDTWNTINHSTNFAMQIKPTSIGSLKMLVKIKSQSGAVIEKQLNWNVQPGQFTFNLNNTVYPNIFLNQPYPINLYVERGINQPADATFQVKYVIEEGAAQLIKNGSLLEENVFIPIQNATNTEVTIKPTVGGTLKIKFTAQDSYGSPIEKTLLWSVTNAEFEFNATTNTQSIYPTQSFNTNVMVDGTDFDNNMTFILKWGEVNAAGNFIGNVQTLPVNQAFYQGNVSFTFPEDGNWGNRTFRVEARNNHQIIKTRDFVIDVKDPKPIINSYNLQWDFDDGGHPWYDFEISAISVTRSPLASTNNFVTVEVRVDGVLVDTYDWDYPQKGIRVNINNGESEASIRVIDSDGRKTDWMTKAIPWP